MVSPAFYFKNRRRNDFPYYRQMWIKVVLVLLTVALIPLMVIGGGVASYTFEKLEAHTLNALYARVRRHQEAIDTFIAERDRQLRMIAAMNTLDELAAPGRLDAILTLLHQQLPGLTDLGVIDMQGRHRAYSGPYDLMSHTYDREEWFGQVIREESYVSDVYLGHRKTPHFIVAVRQGRDGNAFILRATVDSTYFDALVAEGPDQIDAESFIVNGDGLLQTRSSTLGAPLTATGIHPDPASKGIQTAFGPDKLVVTLWQKKVPWLSVVQVSRKAVYGAIHRARLAVIITFAAGALLILGVVLLTTGNLIGLLEAKGQSIRSLDRQLRRTSYLSSSMELAMGFFEEVKDTLSNIHVSAQWLIDRQPAENDPEKSAGLRQIEGESLRGHGLVEKFIQYMDSEEPIITAFAVQEVLEDLLMFLDKEIRRRHIDVVREYRSPLPLLRSDRGKVRQLFQNLILNAMAALQDGGRLQLIVRFENHHIVAEVRDTGPGIPAELRTRIFEPLFSTKARGTGLGLPICQSIVEQLGGSLSVASEPGHGAAFTVRLPGRNHMPEA